MLLLKKSPVVKGEGFNPDGGGFSHLIINGKSYPAHVVAVIVEALTQPQTNYQNYHSLHAAVFKENDEDDWTLKIQGMINGVNFEVEHSQPASVPVEKVAELQSHYEAIGFVEDLRNLIDNPVSNNETERNQNKSYILAPDVSLPSINDLDLVAKDFEIKSLKEVITNLEDYRGKDWLQLHDDVIIAEKKASAWQKDNARLLKEGTLSVKMENKW